MTKKDDPPTITKLLRLAGSPNDTEALTALRTAIAVLAKKGVHWVDFANRVGATATEKERPSAPKSFNEVFADIMRSARKPDPAKIAKNNQGRAANLLIYNDRYLTNKQRKQLKEIKSGRDPDDAGTRLPGYVPSKRDHELDYLALEEIQSHTTHCAIVEQEHRNREENRARAKARRPPWKFQSGARRQ